jgi:hypothetical protein
MLPQYHNLKQRAHLDYHDCRSRGLAHYDERIQNLNRGKENPRISTSPLCYGMCQTRLLELSEYVVLLTELY